MTSEAARLINYRKFDGDRVTLSTLSEPAHVNGLGPVVRVSLYDQRTYSGPTAVLVLGDEAEQRLSAALARLEVPGAASSARRSARPSGSTRPGSRSGCSPRPTPTRPADSPPSTS